MTLIRRLTIAAGLAMATAPALASTVQTNNQAETHYFSFVYTNDVTRQPEEFVIALTDPAMIKKANDILGGKERNEVRISGVLEKGRTDYNGLWPFYLRSDSIAFSSNAIEVCEASPRYVEEHLELVGTDFLPDNAWCPWTSRLVREVKM